MPAPPTPRMGSDSDMPSSATPAPQVEVVPLGRVNAIAAQVVAANLQAVLALDALVVEPWPRTGPSPGGGQRPIRCRGYPAKIDRATGLSSAPWAFKQGYLRALSHLCAWRIPVGRPGGGDVLAPFKRRGGRRLRPSTYNAGEGGQGGSARSWLMCWAWSIAAPLVA